MTPALIGSRISVGRPVWFLAPSAELSANITALRAVQLTLATIAGA